MTSAGCSQGLTVEVIDDMKVNRHLPPCTPGGPGTGESRSVGRVAPVIRCDYGPECLGKSFVAWCHIHAHRDPLYPTGKLKPKRRLFFDFQYSSRFTVQAYK